jgi:hypothetical protein
MLLGIMITQHVKMSNKLTAITSQLNDIESTQSATSVSDAHERARDRTITRQQLDDILSELKEMREERNKWHRDHQHKREGESTGSSTDNTPLPDAMFVGGKYMMSVDEQHEVNPQDALISAFNSSNTLGTPADYVASSLQGFALHVTDINGNTYPQLQLNYMGHIAYLGDSPVVAQDNWVQIGSEYHPAPNALQGVSISLTGEWASKYTVNYIVWMRTGRGPSTLVASDVTSNGAFAGTRGQARNLVALKVWLVKN